MASQASPSSVPLRSSDSHSIIVEPTPETQHIYNEIRLIRERARLQAHFAPLQNLFSPSSAPFTSTAESPNLDKLVSSPSQDEISRNQDLPKRPRGRRRVSFDTDTRMDIKLKLKLACPNHRAEKTTCNCHDFSKLENGFQNLLLHQRIKSTHSPNETFDFDVDILNQSTEDSTAGVRSRISRMLRGAINIDPAGEARTKNYISILAEDLLKKVGAKELDDQTVDRLSSILPALLTALAYNLGHDTLSQVLRDMMVFVYKHRHAIATSFRGKHYQTTEPDSKLIQYNPLLADADEEIVMPGLEIFKVLVFEDPGYMWLLHELRREVACPRPKPSILNTIRGRIFRTLPQMSQKYSSKSVKVVYIINWDIIDFLRTQDYSIPDSEAIAKAITLTGSYTDAQALSCRQYMAQTWPLTGVRTLRLMQEVLEADGKKKKLSFDTPSKLTLEIWIKGRQVFVSAQGLPDFVAEIGEQFAWLGSILRTSPFSNRITLCISFMQEQEYPVDFGQPQEDIQLRIGFRVETSETRSRNENGQCWQNLFVNPVVAHGFPILQRSQNGTGLEMPLDMLAVLARAQYIDTFNSKTFIKGFSTMLVPTRQSEDLLVWHLLYNEDPNERISYLDCGLEHIDVQIPHLEQCRHILGWCSSAVSIVGTAAAPYEVGPSMLPKAHSGCFLEKVEISGGQFVIGTAAFAVGRREKPVSISRFGYYVKKMQWITTKYFIFWDEEEKRGWLVNGASALLHILRASLGYSKHQYGSKWNPDCLLEMANQSPMSAYDVLVNEKNRDVELYLDRTEVFEEEVSNAGGISKGKRRVSKYYRMEDEVEHVYNILEKLIDHQAMAEQQPGFEINVWPRRQLEGWDFDNLITGGDPFFGRVADLHPLGKGWVDFTRTIRAVTFLGRGFGELIKPQPTTARICHRWSSLPSKRYYLAALVSDLKEIMKRHGNPASNPRELCHNVTLNMKDAIFDPCPCTQGKNRCRDPVQALFPLNFFIRIFKPKSQVALNDGGAVIFGHNMDLHWQWRDSGDPVEGDLLRPDVDSGIGSSNLLRPDVDSGIGSSINSSGNQSPSESNISAAGGNVQPLGSTETPQRIFMKKPRHYLSGLFGRSAKKTVSNTPGRHPPSNPP